VASRLGYDPFFPTAERTIVVVIGPDPPQLRGKVLLLDSAGVVQGQREFSTALGRCRELVHAMALSVSIAIDPAAPEPQATAQEIPAIEPSPALTTGGASSGGPWAQGRVDAPTSIHKKPRPRERAKTRSTDR
jgi:hypothetical protein